MVIVQPLASVTVTVTGEQPTVVGVPVIVAVVGVVCVNIRPGGSDPLWLNVYGAVPPLAVRISLYGTPGVAVGSMAGVTVKPVTVRV
jgi:hypothetical protein